MRAYSMDLRERVLRDSDAGMKAAAVAVKYHVSASWVRRLKQRRRETGEVAPRQQRYGRHPVLAPQLHTLAALIQEQPSTSIRCCDERISSSRESIWRTAAGICCGSGRVVCASTAKRARASGWTHRCPAGARSGVTDGAAGSTPRSSRTGRLRSGTPSRGRARHPGSPSSHCVVGVRRRGDAAREAAAFVRADFTDRFLARTLTPRFGTLAGQSPRTCVTRLPAWAPPRAPRRPPRGPRVRSPSDRLADAERPPAVRTP